MDKSKNILTIKDWTADQSKSFEVGLGYTIQSRTVGTKTNNTLIVNRKSDRHSTRIRMFADLRRSQPGYETLGFSEMTLATERYDAAGKFLSRTVIIFTAVAVDDFILGSGEETIRFAFAESTEMTVSSQGVVFR